MMGFLERVIEQKKREIAAKRIRLPLEALRERGQGSRVRDFHQALTGGERIIAEVKKKSPKVTHFRQAPMAHELAITYQANGAAAISVVTDEANFGTTLADAKKIRRTVALPLIVKDFYIDPYQIHEARAYGADAVLLISRILSEPQLGSLLELVHGLGMNALVEVHDERDLARAAAAGATIVGINNRDLGTLEVSLDTTRRLLPNVNGDALVVSESGIRNRSEIAELAGLGVDAFLIGGALLESGDPGAVLRSFLNGRINTMGKAD
jgi:indole-3-glycerol phosphate synthase